MNYTREQLEFQRDVYSNMGTFTTTVTVASLVAFLNDALALYKERDELTAKLAQAGAE